MTSFLPPPFNTQVPPHARQHLHLLWPLHLPILHCHLASSRAQTNFSSSRTKLGHRPSRNGASSASPSALLYPSTHLLFRTVDSSSNFTLLTQMMSGSTVSINDFGCNTAAILPLLLARLKPTSSHLRILRRTELHAKIWYQFDVG